MLAAAAPGCSTDDAAKKDADKAANKAEKDAKTAKTDVDGN